MQTIQEYDGTEFALVDKAVEEYHEKLPKLEDSEKGLSKEKVPPKEKPELTPKKKSTILQPTQPSSVSWIFRPKEFKTIVALPSEFLQNVNNISCVNNCPFSDAGCPRSGSQRECEMRRA